MSAAKTLFDKLWERHLVRPQTDATPAVLYIDLHLVHEVTSAQAFTELRNRGLKVRAPQRTIATMDHSTPTTPGGFKAMPVLDQSAQSRKAQLDQLAKNCEEFGIPLLALGDKRQGIVHVIGPELGLTQPGMTVVCGDSHTSTHGAFGATCRPRSTVAASRRSEMRALVQLPKKTTSTAVPANACPAVSPMYLSAFTALSRSLRSASDAGSGTGWLIDIPMPGFVP
jgi:3-isopropylmalate/(R)-2-methylmalate dehydratase large subunit